jgi:hypothetical protein
MSAAVAMKGDQVDEHVRGIGMILRDEPSAVPTVQRDVWNGKKGTATRDALRST